MSVKLFCLVKGKKITNAFSVKISRDEPISELKKVEIGGDHLDDQLKNLKLNDSDELIAIRKISEYFVDPPAEKHVHVLVEPPASTVSTATSSREQELLRRIVSLEERLNTTHIQRYRSDKLKDYYYSLPITTIRDEDPQRFYPYHCEANNVEKFFYTHRLFDNKLLWRAETEEGSHQIVVKYTRKYNKHAHELCFGIKKAPRLLSVEMICGFNCVVMDYIEGRRLSECDDLKRSEYVTIIKDIEETILYLHSKDIVFTDLRDSNILVFKDESSELRGMLIDFDWAGVNNVDRYPPLMNPNINWPDGARDHMPLDKYLLFHGYLRITKLFTDVGPPKGGEHQ
ncbi:hypothetical protein RclHR1_07040007 [Rhizophagus clarus]|uniref:Protein kinase domain-containing protein n=1 Tax=Rhizophagus clarus TaxID=94130 RepID=A0A2Z6RVH4_9GLOM|nr:hypothetical protein RclHR1_07040007 [Rhizophagus clarus]